MVSSTVLDIKLDLEEFYVTLDYTDLFYHPLIRLIGDSDTKNNLKQKQKSGFL